MMGSAGGVYGARRTVNRENIKTGGKVQERGDKNVRAGGRSVDFEKGCYYFFFVVSFRSVFGSIFG